VREEEIEVHSSFFSPPTEGMFPFFSRARSQEGLIVPTASSSFPPRQSTRKGDLLFLFPVDWSNTNRLIICLFPPLLPPPGVEEIDSVNLFPLAMRTTFLVNPLFPGLLSDRSLSPRPQASLPTFSLRVQRPQRVAHSFFPELQRTMRTVRLPFFFRIRETGKTSFPPFATRAQMAFPSSPFLFRPSPKEHPLLSFSPDLPKASPVVFPPAGGGERLLAPSLPYLPKQEHARLPFPFFLATAAGCRQRSPPPPLFLSFGPELVYLFLFPKRAHHRHTKTNRLFPLSLPGVCMNAAGPLPSPPPSSSTARQAMMKSRFPLLFA